MKISKFGMTNRNMRLVLRRSRRGSITGSSVMGFTGGSSSRNNFKILSDSLKDADKNDITDVECSVLTRKYIDAVS